MTQRFLHIFFTVSEMQQASNFSRPLTGSYNIFSLIIIQQNETRKFPSIMRLKKFKYIRYHNMFFKFHYQTLFEHQKLSKIGQAIIFL